MKLKDCINKAVEYLGAKRYGNEYVSKCPFCKSDKEKFYLNAHTGQYSCKRASCSASGNLTTLFKHLGFNDIIEYDEEEYNLSEVKHKQPISIDGIRELKETDTEIIDYMVSRGISYETLKKANVFYSDKYNAMCFINYNEDKKPIGVVYRRVNKQIRLEKGSDLALWGKENLDFSNKKLYITEGHPDALTLVEMGIPNVVSVPNGCEALDWIEKDWDMLNKFSDIVLCYDNDEAGAKAIEKVKNRLDFANLYVLQYGDYKDVNDMYMGDCEALYKTVRNPKQIMTDGFISLRSVKTEKDRIHNMTSCGISAFDRIFGGFENHELTIICAESGSGKAQPLYSKISTPSGWKKMGDIKIGDTINGFNKQTKVVGAFPQGIRPVYEIELVDGRKTRADIEHIWSYVSGDGNLRNCLTRDLIDMLDKGIDIFLPETFGVEYDKKELITDPYIFGRELDLKSEVRIPHDYIYTTKVDRQSLILGILNRNMFDDYIEVSSKELSDDIVEICMSLSFGVDVIKTESFYRIFIDQHKDRSTKIKSIKFVGHEKCQCIKVDSDDELYITDDFITTHNTTTISNLANGFMYEGEKVAIWSGELNNQTLKTWLYSVIAGEKAISSYENPFRKGDKISYIKEEYEEQIDGVVDGKLFVYDGNKNDGFTMLKHFEMLHKKHGVTVFFIDNGSILDMSVKGKEKYAGEEEFAKCAAKFIRENPVKVFLVMHPTKTSLNKDPNFTDSKGRVKKPEKYDQYQVKGSSALVNLAPNILFLNKATDHHRAYYAQRAENELRKAGKDEAIKDVVDKIVNNLSMIAYLDKNRVRGFVQEDALFGYSPETRRIYGLSNKNEDLNKCLIKAEDVEVEDVDDGFVSLDDF